MRGGVFWSNIMVLFVDVFVVEMEIEDILIFVGFCWCFYIVCLLLLVYYFRFEDWCLIWDDYF